MFVHAESVKKHAINNGDLYAVIRFGSDYLSNYYEIKFPLSITPFGTTVDTAIWPTANNLDFDLGLTSLKNQRNLSINNPNRFTGRSLTDALIRCLVVRTWARSAVCLLELKMALMRLYVRRSGSMSFDSAILTRRWMGRPGGWILRSATWVISAFRSIPYHRIRKPGAKD